MNSEHQQREVTIGNPTRQKSMDTQASATQSAEPSSIVAELEKPESLVHAENSSVVEQSLSDALLNKPIQTADTGFISEPVFTSQNPQEQMLAQNSQQYSNQQHSSQQNSVQQHNNQTSQYSQRHPKHYVHDEAAQNEDSVKMIYLIYGLHFAGFVTGGVTSLVAMFLGIIREVAQRSFGWPRIMIGN